MADRSVYLLEIDAWTGAAIETLRYATHSKTTKPSDTPANVFYRGCIVDIGKFDRSLFQDGSTLGQRSTSYGSIELANADGALDAWLGYGFDGREWRLKRISDIDAPVSSATLVFRGTVESIDASDAFNTMRLNISDVTSLLQQPFLTTTYAGTTLSAGATAEGTEDLKGQLKPRIYGTVVNVAPKLVNPFNLLYQVSTNAVASITAKDGGVTLSNVGDYPALSSLIAATCAPGQYVTSFANGIFRLGGSPVSTVTADVIEGATLATRSAARVAERMLAYYASNTGLDLDIGSFDALHTFDDSEVGIFVDSDASIDDLIGQIIGPIGGSLLPDTEGVFQPIIVQEPTGTSAETFTLRDIGAGDVSMSLFAGAGDDGAGIPAWSVVVTWGKIWQQMSGGDVVALVSDADKAILTGDPRQVSAQNASIKTAHPNAIEIVIDSLLANQADAQALANRLLAMYSVRRDHWSAPIMPSSGQQVERQPGEIVTLQFRRFGYDAGRKFLVVGRTDDFTNRLVTLELWG